MQTATRRFFFIFLLLPLLSRAEGPIRLDEPWRFRPGPAAGAEMADYADAAWQTVRLPHDWSIAGERTAGAPSDGGGGFFPTGEGWYRHRFDAPADWDDKHVVVHFEGAFRNAEVWLNGQRLGSHAYGYTPFRFELSPHLRTGAENVLAVRVVNEPQPNSRWYTGSGLYRPVWIEVSDPVHLSPDGLWLKTRSLSSRAAMAEAVLEIANTTDAAVDGRVSVLLRDATGAVAAEAELAVELRAGRAETFHLPLEVADPQPWSPRTPHLYTLEARLDTDAGSSDRHSVTAGLRTLTLSPSEGFLLNGEPVLLRGGNVHHDNGLLGAAAFARAETRKAQLLKDAGYNAVRTAHNPPSTAFLDACDRLGLLVLDEIFDGWKSKKLPHDYGEIFDENWEKDLRAFVRRDRHHPSVVMWSIGNEVYERGNAQGVARAHAMAAVVRQLDTSRPVTVGLNGLGETGDWTRLDAIFDGLDVAGYNYELHRHAEDHLRRPGRLIYASESYQSEAFENWQMVQAHPYVIGDFVWSAIDYLGEAGIGRVFPPDEEARAHWEGSHFPWHGAYCGDIDLTGWRKPISWYRELVWDQGTTLYLAVLAPTPGGGEWNLSPWAVEPFAASWTWPGEEGRKLTVEVYSRHPRVRLYHNGEVVGEAPAGAAHAFRARFEVAYAPGELRAVGIEDDREVESFSLETAGQPARIVIQTDRETLRADHQDLAFLTIEVRDHDDRRVPNAHPSIHYTVDGPAELMAIGSGDLASNETYIANPRRAFEGRALVVLRTTGEAGTITVTANAEGLASASTILSSN